jgi:hypothetical protein
MKSVLFVVVFAALGSACFAGTAVYLTGNVAADFLKSPTAQEIVKTFSSPDQPFFWGGGWEVVLKKIGIGGTYLTNFVRDPSSQWWLDWYGQALFLSFHAFGAAAFIDPFVQAGIGSAGRVLLDNWTGPAEGNLYISIFPMLTGGLNVNLANFQVGAKLTWTPFMTPPPVTDFITYPLGSFQVTLSTGVWLGRR